MAGAGTRSRRLRVGRAWLLIAGFALQIAVWVMIIPGYEAYDEFDHLFRASGVTHGQVLAPAHETDGYTTVIADRRLVEAGYAECRSLPYTSHRECAPMSSAGDGLVVVASRAAYYNPAYYAAVGWAERLGSGVSAVVITRAVSVALSLALIAWAVLFTRSWPDPRAGIRGLFFCATPMLLFSLAIVAPNGLEMAGGLLWWVGLITLAQARPLPRAVWPALALAGCLLVTLRSLGPVWLVLATAVTLLWRRREVVAGVRSHARAAVASATAVTVAGAASVAWVALEHVRTLSDPPLAPGTGLAEALRRSAGQVLVMIIQFVAAIPGRNIAPPSVLVVAWMLPFVLLLANVRWRRDARSRRALLVLIAITLLFPIAFQAALFAKLSYFWQSRYLLPLAVGIPLLAALAGNPSPLRTTINDLLAAVGVTVAQVVAVGYGLGWYAEHSPLTRQGTWPLLPAPVLIALSVTGCGLAAAALLAGRRGTAVRDGGGVDLRTSDGVSPTVPTGALR